jgi:hypothetical protein
MENQIDFKNYLNNEFSSSNDKKFTIVLGAGFLKHIISNNTSNDLYNYLTSWDSFLHELNSQIPFSTNSILNFEAIVLQESLKQNEKSASEIEKNITEKLVEKIRVAQNCFVEKNSPDFPYGLFNPNFVSDVICLNFDLIPELVLTQNKIPKVKIIHNRVKSTKSTPIISTRYREINKIKFWHPHGDIANSDSIILGLRKYSLNLKNIEILRKRSKIQQKEVNYCKSWYDALTHNPVIVLGADISDSEWGIWSAIVNRERNFAKDNHYINFRNPIFQMRYSNNKKNDGQSSNQLWFHPLFDEKTPFDSQWKELELLFEQKK